MGKFGDSIVCWRYYLVDTTATPGRLERPTTSFVGKCSIQLSYGVSAPILAVVARLR